jgi:hypothetical protein
VIREAIRAILMGDPAVAARVDNARIYPGAMPQGTRGQSLVYQRTGGTFDTLLEEPQRLRDTRLQLDAWASDSDTAASLIALAETRLNGFSGLVPVGDDSPQAICDVRGIFLSGELEGYDAEAQLYRDGRDFRVMWCRAL